jgi:hypothetical protein
MAGGLAVTKEPGTDPFARRFHDAGYTVLAFDYRHLSESDGEPRQIVRVREQLADWQAAIAIARSLPGVDPTTIAIWGFSASGVTFRRRGSRPQVGGGDRPNAIGRWPGRGAQRRAIPNHTRAPAFHEARRPRCLRCLPRPRSPLGATRRPAGYRHLAYDALLPRWRSSAQPRRQVPRLAPRGRGPLRPSHRVLPPGPLPV